MSLPVEMASTIHNWEEFFTNAELTVIPALSFAFGLSAIYLCYLAQQQKAAISASNRIKTEAFQDPKPWNVMQIYLAAPAFYTLLIIAFTLARVDMDAFWRDNIHAKATVHHLWTTLVAALGLATAPYVAIGAFADLAPSWTPKWFLDLRTQTNVKHDRCAPSFCDNTYDQDREYYASQARKVILNMTFNPMIIASPFVVLYLISPETLSALYLVGGKRLFTQVLSFDAQLPSIFKFFWDCALMISFWEINNYYFHYLLHQGWAYKNIHKVHHEYKSPFAAGGAYTHWFEATFATWGFFAGCIGTHTSYIALVFVTFCTMSRVTSEHTGYDIFHDDNFHDDHHKYFKCNYGNLGVLDAFHGTLRRQVYPKPLANVVDPLVEMKADTEPKAQ